MFENVFVCNLAWTTLQIQMYKRYILLHETSSYSDSEMTIVTALADFSDTAIMLIADALVPYSTSSRGTLLLTSSI